MTNQRFPLQDGRIIQIGIAGGQAKGSTGYAFRFIQKRADQLIAGLKSNSLCLMPYPSSNKREISMIAYCCMCYITVKCPAPKSLKIFSEQARLRRSFVSLTMKAIY